MPIHEQHPALTVPNDNPTLWRYMDIPSFISLLTKEALTFVRADLLEDKHEGTFPEITATALDDWAKNEILKGKLNPVYSHSLANMLENNGKTNTYINCWTLQAHELVHMWKIYSKETGIAIESDYQTLKNSILSKELVYPTVVTYLDYKKDSFRWKNNGMTLYAIKKCEYKAENEFRLIMSFPREIEDKMLNIKTHKEKNPIAEKLYSETPVIYCKMDLDKLISNIHLSPYAPKWYYTIVCDVLAKLGLNKKVNQSVL
ncbi:MAG: hypothetical protein WCV67_17270 [Victivallaceae bacterium]|jgi:hypothetical protein